MQHKYAIDAVDQYLRDLLEVSINLDLVPTKLTCFFRMIIHLVESLWYLVETFVRLCLLCLEEYVNKWWQHLFVEEICGKTSSSFISDITCA